MKLIGQQVSHVHTWLADTTADITADFDKQGAIGSMIIVIETKDIYIKNNEGKWQKFGSTEVIG